MSARAGCSPSMSNCADTFYSLHVTNLALDVVSIAAILYSRSYLMFCIYLVAHHYYGHVVAIPIL